MGGPKSRGDREDGDATIRFTGIGEDADDDVDKDEDGAADMAHEGDADPRISIAEPSIADDSADERLEPVFTDE